MSVATPGFLIFLQMSKRLGLTSLKCSFFDEGKYSPAVYVTPRGQMGMRFFVPFCAASRHSSYSRVWFVGFGLHLAGCSGGGDAAGTWGGWALLIYSSVSNVDVRMLQFSLGFAVEKGVFVASHRTSFCCTSRAARSKRVLFFFGGERFFAVSLRPWLVLHCAYRRR